MISFLKSWRVSENRECEEGKNGSTHLYVHVNIELVLADSLDSYDDHP